MEGLKQRPRHGRLFSRTPPPRVTKMKPEGMFCLCQRVSLAVQILLLQRFDGGEFPQHSSRPTFPASVRTGSRTTTRTPTASLDCPWPPASPPFFSCSDSHQALRSSTSIALLISKRAAWAFFQALLSASMAKADRSPPRVKLEMAVAEDNSQIAVGMPFANPRTSNSLT